MNTEYTTYDTLWKSVLDIMGEDKKLLPFEDEDIYTEIHNGIREYNINTDSLDKIKYNDESESFTLKTSDSNYETRLKLISLYIKQNIYQCKLERFQNVYQYDMSEVKSKFYKDQNSCRENTLSKIKQDIEQLLTYDKDFDFN